jgi:Sec-independent protein translocase protein TatA
MLGSAEVLVIAAVIALVFGADTLARIAREAGKVKREVDETRKELEDLKR